MGIRIFIKRGACKCINTFSAISVAFRPDFKEAFRFFAKNTPFIKGTKGL